MRPARCAAVMLMVVIGVLLSGSPVNARSGDPTQGFGPEGIKGWQALAREPEVAVTTDGVAFLVSAVPDDGYGPSLVSIRRYGPNGDFLGELTLAPNGENDIDVFDADASGTAVYVLLDYGSGFRQWTELIRVLADGQLDETFGNGGSIIFRTGVVPEIISARPDGGVLVGGGRRVRAFTSVGAIDTTFGVEGAVSIPVRRGGPVMDLDVASDGGIVATGLGSITDHGGFVTRMRADGSPVRSFGRDGVAWIGFPKAGSTNLFDVDWAPGGKIVVSGTARNTSPRKEWHVAGRLRPDGSEDTGFSADGWVAFTPEDIGYVLWNGHAAVQPDGKVLLAGGAGRRWAIARFGSDGALDHEFGRNGKLTPLVSKRPDVYVTSIQVDPKRSRVVVAGVQIAGNYRSWAGIGSFSTR